MEDFKERMVVEYIELDEKINKLEGFFKNPKFEELIAKTATLMVEQCSVMKTYRAKLRSRMEIEGITHDDVANYKHSYHHLSFGEALQALEAGQCVRRAEWNENVFVTKQIDSNISAEFIPNMKSLPDSAKELLRQTHNRDISYQNQCLLITQYKKLGTSAATNYVPDWNDMFAKDWEVI